MTATITNATVTGTTLNVVGTGGTPGGRVGVYIDGTLASARATPDSGGNWSIAIAGLTSGSHEIKPADVITAGTSLITQFLAATATIGSPVGTVTTDTTPRIEGVVTNPNDGKIAGLTSLISYRPEGAPAFVPAGSVTTDATGAYAYEFAKELPDGPYEIVADVLNVTVRTPVIRVTVSKPDEAPIMPPVYTDWLDSVGLPNRPEGAYGYYGAMVVGIGAPNGWELGRVGPINQPKPAVTGYTMTGVGPGDTAGLAIHPTTGMITVSDTTQISVTGVRVIQVTAINAVGSNSTRVPIEVVSAAQGKKFVATNGDDANAGNLPHLPKATPSTVGQVYLRRGDHFVSAVGLAIGTGIVVKSYGDPMLENPIVENTTGAGLAHNSTKGAKSSCKFYDINFRGRERCVMLTDGGGNLFVRCVADGNKVNTNNSQGFYLHNQRSLKMFHCSTNTVFGDGVIMTKPQNCEIAWMTFAVPESGAADCCQVTFVGKPDFVGYDVYMHDCVMYQRSDTSSLKGSLVFEGIGRYLVERCTMYGKYFCFSNQGNNCTVRDNYMVGGKYPAGNTNAFGIACGGERGLPDTNDASVGHDVQIYDNVIEDCYNAMASAGFGDGDTLQRPDFEYEWNDVRDSTIFFKFARATSGVLRNNIGSNNRQNVVRNGPGSKVATGGDFTTMEIGPNTFQATRGPLCTVRPTVTGIIKEGETVTLATTGVWTGNPTSFEVVWRLNGRQIGDAQATTYLIGAGLAAQVNPFLPVSLQKAELSCVVVATDASGRKGITQAVFPALAHVGNRSVKYAAIEAAAVA